MKKQTTAAREQFLKDLQQDQDYIRHRDQAKWKEIKHSQYIGFYTGMSGTYGVATINNDTSKIKI